MKKTYQKIKLGDACFSVKRGISPKYVENDGIVVINQKCVRNGALSFFEARLTSRNTKIGKDKFIINGDILINSTGTGTLGRSAPFIGKKDFKQLTADSHVAIVRPDPKKTNPLYLAYQIGLMEPVIINMAKGATNQVELSPVELKELKLFVPDREVQDKIANILVNYNNLIDTNRRRIQLLEEAARLLFREWFVYFRFPGHEKVKIVDLGVKKIPAGWDYLPFTKIKLFKKAPLGVPVFTDTRHYYQTSEIDGTSITGNGEEVDYENRPSRADITPRINTVYFAKMKDTDKVLYFNKGNTYLLEKVLLSTGMVGFTADEKYLGFLFGLLTSYEFVQYKNNFATGATQVSLNDASLKKIKVLFPALNLVLVSRTCWDFSYLKEII